MHIFTFGTLPAFSEILLNRLIVSKTNLEIKVVRSGLGAKLNYQKPKLKNKVKENNRPINT